MSIDGREPVVQSRGPRVGVFGERQGGGTELRLAWRTFTNHYESVGDGAALIRAASELGRVPVCLLTHEMGPHLIESDVSASSQPDIHIGLSVSAL